MLPFLGDYLHAKNQRYSLLPERLMDKESGSLIRREYFSLKLENQNFLRYGICTGKQRIAMLFILGYFQRKGTKAFYEKLKNFHFGLIQENFCRFQSQREFFRKIHFLHFFLFLGFYCCEKFQKKLVSRSQEKLVTDVQTDGLTDAWMHRRTSNHEFIKFRY